MALLPSHHWLRGEPRRPTSALSMLCGGSPARWARGRSENKKGPEGPFFCLTCGLTTAGRNLPAVPVYWKTAMMSLMTFMRVSTGFSPAGTM